jgi:coenzyme F420-reducing hydrogenase alpha subunit
MPDMIVTLLNTKINIDDGKISFLNEEFKAQYPNISKYRTYIANFDNREYLLACPEITSETGEKMVFWPSFKLRYRKYPVYVYIYAVALYLSTNKSMRTVAEEVKRKFGLEKLSHSTVSRSLKRLIENIYILSGLQLVAQKNTQPIKRKNWNNEKLEQLTNLLKIVSPILSDNNIRQYGSLLNYQFFEITKKFPV